MHRLGHELRGGGAGPLVVATLQGVLKLQRQLGTEPSQVDGAAADQLTVDSECLQIRAARVLPPVLMVLAENLGGVLHP